MYKYSKKTENKALELFDKGYNIKELSDYLGLTKSTGRLLVIRNNRNPVLRPNQIQKVTFNPFDKNTKESNYWLGYFLADGFLNKNSNSLGISSSELGHIRKFGDYIGGDYTLHKNKNNCYSILFSNKKVKEYLLSIGITSRKSKDLNLKIDLNWDIVRGIFDGDGSISIGVPKITVNSDRFAGKISKFLEFYNIEYTLAIKDKNRPQCKDLRIKSDGRFLFYYYMYKYSKVFLERKRNDYRLALKKFKVKNTGLIAGTLPFIKRESAAKSDMG